MPKQDQHNFASKLVSEANLSFTKQKEDIRFKEIDLELKKKGIFIDQQLFKKLENYVIRNLQFKTKKQIIEEMEKAGWSKDITEIIYEKI